MTTFDGVPGPGEYLTMYLAKLATRASRRNRARSAPSGASSGRGYAFFVSALKMVMTLAGFSCLTIAGFTVNMLAGLIIGGLSFFVLSWLIGGPGSVENSPVDPIMRNR